MITLIISDQKSFREKQIQTILSTSIESEVITYDDTYGEISDLEQYLFPSLFFQATPIIHLKYILSGKEADLVNDLIKKMIASPTSFVFEEMSLSKSFVTTIKKLGAVVVQSEITKTVKKDNDIFAVTKALTAKDKKSRWLAYESALRDNSIEAIIGILYWKVKDMISKSSGQEKESYKNLYRELLGAHAKAWQSGAPLDVLIEKVILTQ